MSGDQFDREKDIEYIKLKMGFIAGAISLDNFIVVIDSTLFPFTARLLRKHINEVFKLPVRFLFLTHYHGDHFWGVAAFNDVIITGSKPLIRNIIDERKIQPARFKEWKKEDPKKVLPLWRAHFMFLICLFSS
jgi:glyoxylase-like metal-dependent hydrolase (beta-lactamase superfamily II)